MFCDRGSICEGVVMAMNIKWVSPERQRALPYGALMAHQCDCDCEAGKRECEEIEKKFFF